MSSPVAGKQPNLHSESSGKTDDNESPARRAQAAVPTITSRTSVDRKKYQQQQQQQRQQQRVICQRCDRPTPSACICAALPKQRIQLKRCHCLVLQHPHEARRKNRSLPIVELCLDANSITVVKGKRFGSQSGQAVLERLSGSTNRPAWLVYPTKDAIPLSQALEQTRDSDKEITLVFLDATWKVGFEVYGTHTLAVVTHI